MIRRSWLGSVNSQVSRKHDSVRSKVTGIGQINVHKSRNSANGVGDGSRETSPYPLWRSPRGFPYPQARGGRGRATLPNHRNRSIVFNSGTAAGSTQSVKPSLDQIEGPEQDSDKQQPNPGWVTKRDRHMQLINNSVYGAEGEKRTKAINHTIAEKAVARDRREKLKVANYVSSLPRGRPSQVVPSPVDPDSFMPEVTISNIRFQVVNGGSKLVRVHGEDFSGSRQPGAISLSSDPLNTHRASPKSTKVGGVTFLRSKNGNLYRSGLVRAHM